MTIKLNTRRTATANMSAMLQSACFEVDDDTSPETETGNGDEDQWNKRKNERRRESD